MNSLQDEYAPKSICYGCGPANEKGFQIKSFVEGNKVIAHWMPKDHHHAFPNVLNGGVIGTLLDCHCNWAAAYYLMQEQGLQHPPCTVTAEYCIQLRRPTPMGYVLTLEASLDRIEGQKCRVNGAILIDDTVYDTCQATFVAVDETHPATAGSRHP